MGINCMLLMYEILFSERGFYELFSLEYKISNFLNFSEIKKIVNIIFLIIIYHMIEQT